MTQVIDNRHIDQNRQQYDARIKRQVVSVKVTNLTAVISAPGAIT
jgi:hypothetical protein